MNAMTSYNFEGAAVRALQIDGEPYFVGKDVAEALGYSDPTTAIRSHCRGVQKLHPIPDSLGRMQDTRFLSEPDVLRLIVNSKLPAAERFERWVFEDVLPSIRKTGGYSMNLSDPAQLRQALLGYTEKVIALESQVSAMEPKVEALNRIALADGSMCLTDAAKHLQVQPKWLFRWLQEKGWIYRRAGGSGFIGYQSRIQVGYLEHKVSTVERSDGSTKTAEQVRVTAKGLAKLAEVFSTQEVA